MEQFTRASLDVLRREIAAALEAVSQKNGLTIEMGNISFSDYNFRVYLEAKIKGKVKDYSTIYSHLPKIGTTFTNAGRQFEVVEHKVSNPKFDVIAECKNDGKRYKFNSKDVMKLAAK